MICAGKDKRGRSFIYTGPVTLEPDVGLNYPRVHKTPNASDSTEYQTVYSSRHSRDYGRSFRSGLFTNAD